MSVIKDLVHDYEKVDSVPSTKGTSTMKGRSSTTKPSLGFPENRASSVSHKSQTTAVKRRSPSNTRPSSNGSHNRSLPGNASSALTNAGNMVAGSSRTSTPDILATVPQTQGQKRTPVSSEPDEERDSVSARLRKVGFMGCKHELFMHGRAYVGPLSSAIVTWQSDKPPRKDHRTPSWLTASEFQDKPEVTEAKCRQLAGLMRISKKTVLYTGAGISASVIGQAALSGQNKVGWKPDKLTCNPTFTHHALGFLGQQGIIHSWVQQNHDGLPQKAGFPQECINEIHGSWYDPSNPVVKYSGSLHERSFPWMEHDAETADLVIVLGTSLGGLNADQVADNAADRSLESTPQGALGTVCINLQQTPLDGKMTLRLFGKSDDILSVLLQKLGFPPLKPGKQRWPTTSSALVPYDADGRRTSDGRRMWLDLSNDQPIRITPGHNIQGAQQPQYMHIGKDKPGLGRVSQRDEASCSFMLSIEGAKMRLGIWWLEAAIRGAVEVLPIVNQNPKYEKDAVEAAPPARSRSSVRK